MARCECFDFAVSWTYFRSHCITEHGFDPGSNIPEEREYEPPEEPSHLQQQLDHLRAQMIYTQNKVNEHVDKAKGKTKSAF